MFRSWIVRSALEGVGALDGAELAGTPCVPLAPPVLFDAPIELLTLETLLEG